MLFKQTTGQKIPVVEYYMKKRNFYFSKHMDVWMVLARLMETQIEHLPEFGHWVQGGLDRGTMASASTSIWEKGAPSALTSTPDRSSIYVPGNF